MQIYLLSCSATPRWTNVGVCRPRVSVGRQADRDDSGTNFWKMGSHERGTARAGGSSKEENKMKRACGIKKGRRAWGRRKWEWEWNGMEKKGCRCRAVAGAEVYS